MKKLTLKAYQSYLSGIKTQTGSGGGVGVQDTINRTLVELKHWDRAAAAISGITINRTLVELKPVALGIGAATISLSIVP